MGQNVSLRSQEKRGRKLMRKKIFGLALCAVLFALSVPTEAQQPTKTPRLGFLSASSLSAVSARIEAFRQGLRELGYEEGKNIVIEWRSPRDKQIAVPRSQPS
jgi:hypothetical protein